MVRLIDADKRIAEIKQLYCDGCDNYGGAKCRACWVDDAMCLIDDATAADAVEVVRCKECAKDGLFTCPICFIENKTLNFINHSPDFYCGEGERKDGDGNG